MWAQKKEFIISSWKRNNKFKKQYKRKKNKIIGKLGIIQIMIKFEQLILVFFLFLMSKYFNFYKKDYETINHFIILLSYKLIQEFFYFFF